MANAYARRASVDVLENVGLHWPEQLPEIESHLVDLLQRVNDKAIDPDGEELNDAFTYVFTTLKLASMKPMLERLHKERRVSTFTNGPWREVLQYFEAPPSAHRKRNLHIGNLYELYGTMAWTLR